MILLYTHKNSIGHYDIIHIKDNIIIKNYIKNMPRYINNRYNYYFLRKINVIMLKNNINPVKSNNKQNSIVNQKFIIDLNTNNVEIKNKITIKKYNVSIFIFFKNLNIYNYLSLKIKFNSIKYFIVINLYFYDNDNSFNRAIKIESKILSSKDNYINNNNLNEIKDDDKGLEQSIKSEYEENYILNIDDLKNFYYPPNKQSINTYTFYNDIHKYLISIKNNKHLPLYPKYIIEYDDDSIKKKQKYFRNLCMNYEINNYNEF